MNFGAVHPDCLCLEKFPDCVEVTGNMTTLERAGLSSGMSLRVLLLNESTSNPGNLQNSATENSSEASRGGADGHPSRKDSVADSLAHCELDVLFRLLRCGSIHLVQQVWQVLQLLPTCDRWRRKFANPVEVRWATLLPPNLVQLGDDVGMQSNATKI